MRGEYLEPYSASNNFIGSSPLARGIHQNSSCASYDLGISPACAGNTYALSKCFCQIQNQPRLRGEYLKWPDQSAIRKGSAPLARGILYMSLAVTGVIRISPACAGNTAMVEDSTGDYKDHPRLRGEYSKKLDFP